jgi:DNA invertase Pin-like site-specific DNA recombinase
MSEQVIKKRRSACYARVSTNDQAKGLDAQIRALRIYCEQNNITDWELFADEAFSGTKASRPSLDRMMAAVEAGEIDNVIVFAFSRYARSVTHMLKGLEVMKRAKTNFVSLSEKLDLNTSLGNVVFIIISAIAQLERDLIAERVRNGLAAAKARGAKIGRVRTRNSVLIESLLDAGLSFRTISRLAKCSHGSVSAQKKEWLARKSAEERKRQEHEMPTTPQIAEQVIPRIQMPPEIAARLAEADAQAALESTDEQRIQSAKDVSPPR